MVSHTLPRYWPYGSLSEYGRSAGAVHRLADHCDLYNAALQERREAWRMGTVSIRYGDQSAQLREIRADDPNGRVKTLQLKREYRRWYVVVVAEEVAEPLVATGRAAGVDLGVARFLTTSDGGIVANPRFLDQARTRIAELERRKARATLGSGNRRRLRRRLARQWRQVRNQRRDFHHKTARALVDAYDTIALEDLRVATMTRGAKAPWRRPVAGSRRRRD